MLGEGHPRTGGNIRGCWITHLHAAAAHPWMLRTSHSRASGNIPGCWGSPFVRCGNIRGCWESVIHIRRTTSVDVGEGPVVRRGHIRGCQARLIHEPAATSVDVGRGPSYAAATSVSPPVGSSGLLGPRSSGLLGSKPSVEPGRSRGSGVRGGSELLSSLPLVRTPGVPDVSCVQERRA